MHPDEAAAVLATIAPAAGTASAVEVDVEYLIVGERGGWQFRPGAPVATLVEAEVELAAFRAGGPGATWWIVRRTTTTVEEDVRSEDAGSGERG